MAKVKIQGHASGTGVITVTAPNTSTDRTLTLPDNTGSLLTSSDDLPAANLTGTVADARISTLTASKLSGALPAISGASLTGIPVTGLTSQQVFTSSGTWTKPTGITKVKVIVTGGGGGGGGMGNASDVGAGGGAGGTAIEIIDVSSVSSVAVTVGAGGAEGASTAKGATGATSSFGSYCSATGGEGGEHGNAGAVAGGEGGVGSGGPIILTGNGGMGGFDGGTNNHPPGIGGGSFWGGALPAPHHAHNPNFNSLNGAGGPGGYAATSETGGNGGNGLVVVEEYK